MEEYFARELKALNKELTDYKTAAQKSGGSLTIVSKTITVTANLEYKDISYPTGSARARVFYEVDTSYNSIIVPTLSWYAGDIMQAADIELTTRQIELDELILPNGNYGVSLYFIGTEKGANSDAARTKNGETVTVSVNLTIKATNDFTIRKYNP